MTTSANSEPHDPRKRPLLVMMAGVPLQPVRLYYSLPARTFATRVFSDLGCMAGGTEGTWLWHSETGILEYMRRRKEVPVEVHPIIIGRFRFPATNRMVLEVRSAERAIEAAKFFGPRFGPKVVLRRVRVLNRFIAASEGAHDLDRLDKLIDHNVVKIGPAVAEAEIEAALAGALSLEETLQRYMAFAEQRRMKDVPLVEDFPLAPEEEGWEFRDLAMALRFRSLRAMEHWKGHTHLTLADVIHRALEPRGFDGPAG